MFQDQLPKIEFNEPTKRGDCSHCGGAILTGWQYWVAVAAVCTCERGVLSVHRASVVLAHCGLCGTAFDRETLSPAMRPDHVEDIMRVWADRPMMPAGALDGYKGIGRCTLCEELIVEGTEFQTLGVEHTRHAPEGPLLPRGDLLCYCGRCRELFDFDSPSMRQRGTATKPKRETSLDSGWVILPSEHGPDM